MIQCYIRIQYLSKFSLLMPHNLRTTTTRHHQHPITMFRTFSLLLLLAPVLAFPQLGFECGSKCTYRLCETDEVGAEKIGRLYQLRPPRIAPHSPAICHRSINDRIGYITSAGEAQVQLGETDFVGISKWRPDGLTKRFGKRFFRAVNIRALRRSGIARSTYRGNQRDFLDLACFNLPILEFETVTKPRRNPIRVFTAGKDTDCVSFRGSVMKIFAELSWEGSDGFELSLLEPDGTALSRINPRTTRGFFQEDLAVNCRVSKLVGDESAVYRQRTDGQRGVNIPRGTYTYDVDHFESCGNGPSRWTLRITVNGNLVVSIGGASDEDGRRLAHGTFEVV